MERSEEVEEMLRQVAAELDGLADRVIALRARVEALVPGIEGEAARWSNPREG